MKNILLLCVLLVAASALEQNGMTFTNDKYCPNITYGSEGARESLRHLRTIGANWVAIVTTWYQDTEDGLKIFPLNEPVYSKDGYFEYISPTDEDLASIVTYARSIGFKVMLKPHIDPINVGRDVWRGWIGGNFDSED